MKSKQLSQNFIKNIRLIDYLIHNSSITKNDTVLEIGSGTGNITKRLTKFSKRVIAIEKDIHLYKRTMEKVSNFDNVNVIRKDVLKFRLPNFEYKVFANIPFGITTAILKKLLNIDKAPLESYIIIQQEAAERFVNKIKTTQIAVLYKPYFTFNVFHRFKSGYFYPKASVDIVMLNIKKRSQYLISLDKKQEFENFIYSAFHSKKSNIAKFMKNFMRYHEVKKCAREMRVALSATPSEITFDQWMILFKSIYN